MMCPEIDVWEGFLDTPSDENSSEAARIYNDLSRHLASCVQCEARVREMAENLRVVAPIRRTLNRDRTSPVDARAIPGFTLLREIDRGGMSVVFLAEQEHPRRRVAVKILSQDFNTEHRRLRFVREAEVLGRLRHPDIAQIYQAGVLKGSEPDGRSAGRPYIVMEHVEGQRLDEYLRHETLSLPQRLELLAQICDAIHFAHLKGVIHRDLKPGNILVSRERGQAGAEEVSGTRDGRPEASQRHSPNGKRVLPSGGDRLGSRRRGVASSQGGEPESGFHMARVKVLDFGLAHVEGDAFDQSDCRTLDGQFMGTLPYMSPEQVAGDSDGVDARSDVHALGVIGFEMLARRPPFELTGLSLLQAAEVVRKDEALRLSSLDRSFRGDVDAMFAKALAREPGRRYQSAAEFAADLRRCLYGEPVTARAPGSLYILSKLARRHRALVTTAVAAMLALVAVTAAAVGQAREAMRERDAATRRLAHARQTAEYVLSGVGGQLGRILGATDVRRHLAEESYVFFHRLLEEEPADAGSLRGLMSAGRALIGHSLQDEDLVRAGALAASLEGLLEKAEALSEPRLLMPEIAKVHDALAKVARKNGQVEESARQAGLARRTACEWAEAVLASFDPAAPSALAVAENGLYAGSPPEGIKAMYVLADLAERDANLALDEGRLDAAEDQIDRSLKLYGEALALDPTADPLYRTDVSSYAQPAPPILLHGGSRPSIERRMAALTHTRGLIAQRRGDERSARAFYNEGLEILERQSAAWPNDPGVMAALAAAHMRMARFLDSRVAESAEEDLGDGLRDPAVQHAQAALVLHERLAKSDPKHVGRRQAAEADRRYLAEKGHLLPQP